MRYALLTHAWFVTGVTSVVMTMRQLAQVILVPIQAVYPARRSELLLTQLLGMSSVSLTLLASHRLSCT